MALRNQPYMPLYVNDFLTDEKLNECSAKSTGVYIKIMCLMHKSEEYGVILLKQKDKQKGKQKNDICSDFAYKLAKLLPFDEDEIYEALIELTTEKVLHINDDKLIQKRMVKDCEISEKRALAGSQGGKSTTNFAQAKRQAKGKAKSRANSEYIYVNENDNVNSNIECHLDYKYKEESCLDCFKKFKCKLPTSEKFKISHDNMELDKYIEKREEDFKKFLEKATGKGISTSEINICNFDDDEYDYLNEEE